MQDEAWIQAIRDGGPAEFQLFVEAYGAYLYRTVYAVVRSPHDAEDITQEVLLQIYRSLPECRLDGFKTWMTRIAVNKAIDWKRSKARKPEELVESMSKLEEQNAATGAMPAEEAVLQGESQRQITKQIDSLPDNYREVITAYYMDHKSYEEIAAQTGLERKSVESRLYRARNWIRRHWRKEDFE